MVTVVFGNVNNVFFLEPGKTTFVHIFGNDMTKYNGYSAGPNPGSPAGASVQTITQWATPDGTIHFEYKNNGNEGVLFTPRFIEVSP